MILRAPALTRRMRLGGSALAAVCLLGAVGLWAVFVRTRSGQFLEAAALEGSRIGSHYVNDQARALLSVVSMPAAVALVVVILLVGLARRSHRRAIWAVIAVVGANASTQILKHWVLVRPDYDMTVRWDNANTLPSGHTTIAASAAVALVLLAGGRWRGWAAWAGAAGSVAMGYSTLVCQWHRPADVLAALLVAVAWGGIAVAGGAWADGAEEPAESASSPELARQRRITWLLACLGALSALPAVALGLWVLSRLGESFARTEYFASYAVGSAATVAVGCLTLASVTALGFHPSPSRRPDGGSPAEGSQAQGATPSAQSPGEPTSR
ncbi:phosphatase PAP2 family protein [Actinomyces slackii]|nr:phosphatase PAP2 family protein [Actinomyces slackii]